MPNAIHLRQVHYLGHAAHPGGALGLRFSTEHPYFHGAAPHSFLSTPVRKISFLGDAEAPAHRAGVPHGNYMAQTASGGAYHVTMPKAHAQHIIRTNMLRGAYYRSQQQETAKAVLTATGRRAQVLRKGR